MKKINRLLAFLLAFTVVITTFSSDYTAAHVYATEEETLQNADDAIKTADWEAVDGEKASATNVSAESSTEGSTEESVVASTEGTTTEVEGTTKPEGDAVVTGENDDAATAGTVGEVTNPEAVVATEDGEAKKSDDNDKFDSEAKELKETVDGIDIFVSADAGVLPSNAELRVSKVSSSDEEKIQDLIDETTGEEVTVEETISFDINIYSESEGDPENNYYVQPKGDVEVRFESVEAAESEDVALSVYHVNDDINEAVPMSDEVTGDETEVTIETSHFSIYAVTLTRGNTEKTFSIKLVDLNNNEIGTVNGTETVSVSGEKDVSAIAPIVNGYSFYRAYYNGQRIYTARIENGKIQFEVYSYSDYWYDYYEWIDANNIEVGDVVFMYTTGRVKTYNANHVDLRFTDTFFRDHIQGHDNVAVYCYVGEGENAPRYTMTWVAIENGQNEYRARTRTGRDLTANSNQKIRFVVVDNGKEYKSPVSDEAHNIDAYNRCCKDHPQGGNGFDFEFSFEKDFINSGVTYYANDGRTDSEGKPLSAKDPVSYEDGEEGASYTVKTITDTGMGSKDSYVFKGWSTTANGPVNPDYSAGTEITVSTALELYAVWEVAVSFTDYPSDEYTAQSYQGFNVLRGSTVVDNQIPTPTVKPGFAFDKWYVYDGNNNLVEFTGDYRTITEPTVVYAKYKKNVSVKYYVVYPDRTSNKVVTCETVTVPEGTEVTIPDRTKYSFDSSYVEDGFYSNYSHSRFSGEITPGTVELTENKNVYVKLKKNTATYTVKYIEKNSWPENELKTAVTDRTGNIGDTATASDADKALTFTAEDGAIYSFDSVETATINADNTAVVKVYYKKTCTKYVVNYFFMDENGNYANQPSYSYTEGNVFVGAKVNVTPSSKVSYGWTTYTFDASNTNNKTEIESLSGYPFTGNVINLYYMRTKFKAYYKVNYFYQKKNGSYDESNPDFSYGLYEVEVDTTKNGGKVTKSITPDKTSRLYSTDFVRVDNKGNWSVDVTKDNTCSKPAVINVYYQRTALGVQLTIFAGDDNKLYDGTYLTTENTTPTFTVIDEAGKDLSSQYRVIVTTGGQQLNAGTGDSKITSYVVHKIGTNQYYYYNDGWHYNTADKNGKINGREDLELDQITLVDGTLTVNPRPVTFTVGPDSKEYDRWIYDVNKYDGTITYKFYDENGQEVQLSWIKFNNLGVTAPWIRTVAESNKSTTELGLAAQYYATVFGCPLSDFWKNKNFAVTVVNGDLTIDPKPVTLVSDHREKEFDGKVLVNGNTPLKLNNGWVWPEYAVPVFTGSQLKIGESDNSFTLIPGFFTDFANYKFVSASDESKVYTEADTYEGADGKTYQKYGDFGKLKVTGDPSTSIVKIFVSVDGDGKNEKTVTYNGSTQSVEVSVDLSHNIIETKSEGSEKTETDETEENTVVTEQASLLDKLLSFGTLTAYAAEEGDVVYTFEYAGTTFYVTGIELEGGSGVNVGDYFVTLNKGNVKVQTKDDSGNYTDVTDQFTVVVDTPESSKEETSENGEIAGVLHVIPAHVTVTASTGLSKRAGSSDPTFTATVAVDDENITAEERAAITEEANNSVAHGVARQTGESTGNYVVKLYGPNGNEYTERTDETEVQGNFIATYVPGVFTINSAPSNREEEESTPETPVEFVPLAAAPGVLGAQRALPGEAPAVLGARRSGTSDTNILGSIITIIVAAAIAFSMVFIKRKKKEEN